MNHFDEITCLLYLEGQLDPSRARELTDHIAHCADCRVLLNVLERESLLLSNAITEETESVPARLLSTPGWNPLSWVWVATFGLFAAGAFWIWTDAIAPWIQELTDAGFGGMDLATMVIFSGAFWEGWVDMIDVLQIVALIAVGMMAFSLLRKRSKRTAAIAMGMFALLLALAMPRTASAAEVRNGQTVVIAASETIHNDLLVSGRSVRIDGTVEGDVIAFTGMLIITGRVTGDVIAFAGQIRMDGVVDGNVRVISNSVTIDGSVGKNISSLVNTLDLTQKATIGGSLISIDGQATIYGNIHGDMLGLIRQAELGGKIGRDFSVRGSNLMIGPAAEIGGRATYRGRRQPTVAPGAKLATPLQVVAQGERRRMRFTAFQIMVHHIVSYAATMLLALLIVTALPVFFRTTLRETGRIGLPFGVGALSFAAGLLLLILGVLLIFVGVGAGIASVLLLAPILYVAQVFVSAWLGNRILGVASPEITSAIIGRIAVGLLVLHIVGLIPLLGTLVWMAAIVWGTGSVLLGFYRLAHGEARATAEASA